MRGGESDGRQRVGSSPSAYANDGNVSFASCALMMSPRSRPLAFAAACSAESDKGANAIVIAAKKAIRRKKNFMMIKSEQRC